MKLLFGTASAAPKAEHADPTGSRKVASPIERVVKFATPDSVMCCRKLLHDALTIERLQQEQIESSSAVALHCDGRSRIGLSSSTEYLLDKHSVRLNTVVIE